MEIWLTGWRGIVLALAIVAILWVLIEVGLSIQQANWDEKMNALHEQELRIPNQKNRLHHQQMNRQIASGKLVIDSAQYWEEIEKLNLPEYAPYWITPVTYSRFD